jgi:hypothetical protein
VDAPVIILRPEITGLVSGHEAWQAAYAELGSQLGARPEDAGERPAATKGTASDLAIALGTPTVVAGIVRIVYLWLSQDKHRSLRISRTENASGAVEVHITGENISEQAVREAVQRLLPEASPDERAVE